MTDFTPEEISQLADIVADRVAAKLPPHICVLDDADVAFLKSARLTTNSARKTAFLAAVGALTIAVLTVIGLGVVSWIRKELGMHP